MVLIALTLMLAGCIALGLFCARRLDEEAVYASIEMDEEEEWD